MVGQDPGDELRSLEVLGTDLAILKGRDLVRSTGHHTMMSIGVTWTHPLQIGSETIQSVCHLPLPPCACVPTTTYLNSALGTCSN